MSHAANVYLKAVAADSRPHNHVKKPEIEIIKKNHLHKRRRHVRGLPFGEGHAKNTGGKLGQVI